MEAFLWFLPAKIQCMLHGHVCNISILAQYVCVRDSFQAVCPCGRVTAVNISEKIRKM